MAGSDEQKELFLLRGQALVDAEAWAKGKRLIDEDDQLFARSPILLKTSDL